MVRCKLCPWGWLAQLWLRDGWLRLGAALRRGGDQFRLACRGPESTIGPSLHLARGFKASACLLTAHERVDDSLLIASHAIIPIFLAAIQADPSGKLERLEHFREPGRSGNSPASRDLSARLIFDIVRMSRQASSRSVRDSTIRALRWSQTNSERDIELVLKLAGSDYFDCHGERLSGKTGTVRYHHPTNRSP